MRQLRVGLNGFGRIGRAITRIASSKGHLNIEAINTSSTTPEQLAYTLKYDSVYRTFDKKVESYKDGISIDSKKIRAYNERDPEKIPWNDHNIDVVIDCTGVFKDRESLSKHIRGSVQKVILCVPSDDESIEHIVLGVNEDSFDFAGTDIMSNASCTTNCAAVMTHVLEKAFGIEQGFLTTVHSYTSSQSLVDNKASKFTRGRAAAMNILPTTTGASKAVCKVASIEESQLSAAAIRVPTPVGSITDMVCLLKKEVTVEDIHAEFKKQSEGNMKGILGYEETPLVSSDYIGNPHSCIYDTNYTSVAGGKMVKLFGWYDNEWGYSNRVVDVVERLAEVM